MIKAIQNQVLIKADFLLERDEIEPESVDLILMDPPYGVLRGAQPWDVPPNYHVLAWKFSDQLKSSGQIITFANFKTAVAIEAAFAPYFAFRFNLTWKKSSALNRNHSRPAMDSEMILVYQRLGVAEKKLTFNYDAIRTPGKPFKKKGGRSQNENPTLKAGGNMPEIYENEDGRRYPRTVLEYPNKPGMPVPERTSHPTQKPIGLLEYLLRGFSNPGDLILDPFVGSGSTLVACHNLGRRGIGFERDDGFFDLAVDRLETEIGLQV